MLAGVSRASSPALGQAELVGFHPFNSELPAWNATVAGGTGSGKSFAARSLLTGWLASRGRLIVATRGRDYHRFAKIFDGEVHDVSLDDPSLCLGPFSPPADMLGAGREERLEHLASIIALMSAEPGEVLSRAKRRLIFKTTLELYGRDSGPTPTLKHWLDVLARLVKVEPDSRVLGAELEKELCFWLDGAYGAAFLRNQSTSDDCRLTVWNLERIADQDTQGVVLGLLSGAVAQSIKRGPTVIVMDEVWSLLRSDAGASLVETLYRTVRKEGSAIWTISQSMNDYTAVPESCRSAILNNSPMKLFLRHDSSEIDLVADTFKLNERERQLLGSLRSVPGQFSELLAFFGSRRQLLQLRPTGVEYWIATSHPKDCELEAMAIAASPDVPREEVLKRLARRYPNGAIDVRIQVE